MSVKSVHKALQVLEAVAKEPGGITVREVSERLNFPYATAHRLLQTLKKAGYVAYEGTQKVYRIGPQLINLYRPAPHLADLGRLAYPYLSRLSAEAQETAHLATRSGHEVIYLDTVLPQSSFVMYTPVGARARFIRLPWERRWSPFSRTRRSTSCFSGTPFKSSRLTRSSQRRACGGKSRRFAAGALRSTGKKARSACAVWHPSSSTGWGTRWQPSRFRRHHIASSEKKP